MSLFERVLARLAARRVPSALVGAEALALRGASRATAGRDLLTTDPRALDVTLWAPLAEGGDEVEARRGDDEDPLAGVVRFSCPGERDVDLVVGRPGWMTRLVERAEVFDLGEARVAVPPAADLVLLKLYAGGPQDAWDVLQLLAMPTRDALVAGVGRCLGELPADCRKLWNRLLGESA